MWILFFNGKASHWLLCDASYTVGKANCHITIKDDSSISRRHLTIDVGLPPRTEPDQSDDAVAPVKLTDTSTYGTELLPSGTDTESRLTSSTATRRLQLCNGVASHELSRDEPFVVPTGWREFIARVGTHGAVLHFRWVTIRVSILGIDAANRGKVDECLSRCGAVVTNALDEDNFGMGDGKSEAVPEAMNRVFDSAKDISYVLTPRLEPTSAAMIALSLALPIVTADFFAAICARDEPRCPLPDPIAFAPPVDPFWAELSPTAAANWHTPQVKRRELFTGLTFVSVQSALFKEARGFVGAAGGLVLLDESLVDVVNESRRESLLAAFLELHRGHIVLLNSAERLPFRHCVRILRDTLKLQCVEYADIVRAVVNTAPLIRALVPEVHSSAQQLDPSAQQLDPSAQQLKIAPDSAADRPRGARKRGASPGGRPTNPSPLFLDADPGGPVPGGSAAEAPAPGGWRCAGGGGAVPGGGPGGQWVHSRAAPLAAAAGGKRFAKQSLTAPVGGPVELDMAALPAVAVRAIDAEEIVPDAVEARGAGRFNPFDAAAHVHAHGATRRRVGGQRANTHSDPSACAYGITNTISTKTNSSAYATADVVTHAAAMTHTASGSGTRVPANSVNIFNVDSLF